MKKYFLVIFLIGLFLAGFSLQVHCRSKKTEKTYSGKAAKYQKEAEIYRQSAKKAEEAGQQELAGLYDECAQSLLTIAEKYKDKKSKKEVKAAINKYKENCKKIKKLIKNLKTSKKKDSSKDKKDSAKKAEKPEKKKLSNEEKAAIYMKQSESLKKMADIQRTKGNTEDAAYYDKLAAAKLKIFEAYKNKNMKAVRTAKEEYYNLKQSQK